MSEELKPCPFCGSDCIQTIIKDHLVARYCYNVDCSASGPEILAPAADTRKLTKKERQAAVSAWNTRPVETQLEARIAALKRCVEVADKIREAVGPSSGPPTGKLRAEYDAARAEVKK